MTPLISFAIGSIALIGAAYFFETRSSISSGWSVGPTINGQDYSSPIDIDSTGSFDFPTAQPGVHYVTKGCSSLSNFKGIRIQCEIIADSGVKFIGAIDGEEVSVGPFLYIQRDGDDWSGVGRFDTYRWWSLCHSEPLTPGVHDFTVMFSDIWNSVNGAQSNTSSAEFQAALASASKIGFTFPNHEGAGHGLYATGQARFNLLGFSLV